MTNPSCRMTIELRACLRALRAKIVDARARLDCLRDGELKVFQVEACDLRDLTPALIETAEAEIAEAEQILAQYDPDDLTADN
jgi:hypothetical protein